MSSLFQGGRLSSLDAGPVNFASSVEDDRRIATASVLVNEAHVVALVKAGVVDRDDGRRLFSALRQIEHNPPFRQGVEDVHLLIEEEVVRKVGSVVGGKLHTGKSRNDQVVTAIRMVLREELLQLSSIVLSFEGALLRVARKNTKSLFVGYTHLQPAQPITFAHYLLAIGDSLIRDHERMMESLSRVNLSPMGAGALAGSSFNLDRSLVARLLGFQGVIENSLDAVGGRDFVLEVLGVFAILASDLSRISQDLVFYSSADVGLVELPDQFASTSSIMPQKKNPDVLEVIRARSAKVAGNFSSAITTLHALPTGYNLDFQELTPLLWSSLDILKPCLDVLTRLAGKLTLTGKTPGHHIELTVATEVANVLVREGGMSFRDAHKAVGKAVRHVLTRKCSLQDLTVEDWNRLLNVKVTPKVLQAIRTATNLNSHIYAYKTKGSPNPSETNRLISIRERELRHLTGQGKQYSKRVNRMLGELTRSLGRHNPPMA